MPCTYSARTTLPQLTIRWAGETDRDLLLQQTALADQRMRHGDRAAIVLNDNQLVGCTWIATQVYHDWDTGLDISLEPNEAWLYGAWIHRELRGNHLYSHIISLTCQTLQLQSIDSILLAVDWSNRLSQSVHQSFGAKRIGSLYGTSLCGARFYKLNHQLIRTTPAS